MTNDPVPHENGVADDAATIAALTADTAAVSTETSEPAVAEAPPPSFDDLPGLHPDIKQALDDMGYFAPTAVQTAVYKPVNEGKDLLVQSRTGTGKTTAFGLPLINKLVPTHRAPQAMILAPTRELALQVARELTNIGKHRGIIIEAIYGGAPIGKQIENLKNGVHIIVGTPGRVLDHIGRRTLDTRAITTFVLDECDEMLSMGFLEDIERVVSQLPEKKQTLLFSATMPDEVGRYARRHMVAPEQISLSRDSISVSDIHHAYYIVSGIARSRDLLKILYAEEPESAIIFCNMRDETTMVAKFLQKQGLDAEPLSSDLSQNDRERVMNRMKAKNLRFLCATDVAARGIDISNLSHVINYSVPESPEVYVHRTGRTGRAGRKGTALSLVGPRELGNFRYVRLTFGIKPEERLLPKDDIFIGKLKVPLPPVGTPQPPDPVQILIRGVTNTASELERQIFEKLLSSQSGKRVLAALVAEKLDKLSTRARPKREHVAREERPADMAAAPAGEERPERSFDRDRERGPRPFDRDRGERGGERTGGDRERRPWRDDRGAAPAGAGGERSFDRDRGERPVGDRPERTGGDRPERPAGERGDRPYDRDRGPRSFDRDRGDRGGRDRDRGGRGFDRDRGGERPARTEQPERTERTDRIEAREDAPVVIAGDVAAAETTVTAAPEARADRPERDRGDRGDRHGRDRDRGGRDRHGRDRDRGERRDRTEAPAPSAAATDAAETVPTERFARVEPVAEVGTEAAPAVETVAEPATKVDDVATRALERADRGGKGKRETKKAAPTAETREFWETWAEEKSTRPAEEAAAPAATEADGGNGRSSSRGGRSRGGRGRDKADAKPEAKPAAKAEAKSEAKTEDKPERASRTKRDSAAPAAATGDAQARLFVSLGKKHGVSADDLRELLAAPIGGDKARIGSVSLRDSHAHVRVPEELVEQIISGVHGKQHNKHDVTVERARA